MNKILKANVYLLTLAQICLLATTMTLVTYAGLAGKMLAPSPAFATLPISLTIIMTALSTGALSGFMGRSSRKSGFFLGISLGIIGALVAAAAIWLSSFWMLCIGAGFIGIFTASAQYYRFAAMESVPSDQGAKAVSIVLMGGLVAAFIAPPIVAIFNDMVQPNIYMGPFLFIAFIILCAVIPVSLLKPIGVKVTDEEECVESARPLSVIMKRKTFIAAVLNSSAGFAMMSFVMTATPLAMETCGFGPEVSISVIQAHVIAMFLPGLVTGHLIERFGIVKILFTGHLFLAASFWVAFMGIEIENFSVALVLIGIGWNFCFVGGTSLLVRSYRDSEKSKVQGLNETIVYTCQGVASLGAGAVLYYLGWMSVIQIALAILVVTMLYTIWYALSSRTEKDYEEQQC